MRSNVYWIPGPWQGKLAILARPRGGDWLKDEIQAWREMGIGVVVSLLSEEEQSELDLEDEERLALGCDLIFTSFPIDDYGVPSSQDALAKLVQKLEQLLVVGKWVGVHCRGGIGRSSVVIACLLATAGQNVETSFQLISDCRGRSVPDTLEQRNWVGNFVRSSARRQSDNSHVS